MGELSGIKHELQAFRNSCAQEIIGIESEIRDYKRRYAQLNAESKLYKVFRASKYKERKTIIEKKLKELEERLKELKFEMEIYDTYGRKIPQNIPEYQKIIELIESRDRKLDVIMLVEMGLM